MKKVIWVSFVLLGASLLSQPVLADQGEQEKARGPWERFSVSLGGFFSDLSSDVRIGSKTLGVGTDIDVEDAMNVGRRGVNLARTFNIRVGIGAELDAPSPRYGSTLPDGLAAGTSIMPHWDMMLKNYYHLMGWDVNTGMPLPETLKALQLDFAIPHLYNR